MTWYNNNKHIFFSISQRLQSNIRTKSSMYIFMKSSVKLKAKKSYSFSYDIVEYYCMDWLNGATTKNIVLHNDTLNSTHSLCRNYVCFLLSSIYFASSKYKYWTLSVLSTHYSIHFIPIWAAFFVHRWKATSILYDMS